MKLKTLLEILLVSTKLGLTSFGGPIAHLGYFHHEYIGRRKWMDEKSYADLVALCQFLPGPASSQVGIGIGLMRGGILGGIAAWIGFTLPSVLALILFAFLVEGFNVSESGWLQGLKIVAVAIVAQAVLGMGQKLTPDRKRASIAIIAASIAMLWQSAVTQILIIAVTGIIGFILFKAEQHTSVTNQPVPIRRFFAIICLLVFFLLIILLPILSTVTSTPWIALLDSFYRSGALVFGGGHVVLPLLEQEVVANGWISKEEFLAGYGATQAIPGPLFTFAAYLGTVISGWSGALLATFAIFLPAFLLVVGALPFWENLRANPKIQGALMGVNAGVVGILLAAFYNPIWTSTIQAPVDFVLATILFGMLTFWKLAPWLVVVVGAIGGVIISLI